MENYWGCNQKWLDIKCVHIRSSLFVKAKDENNVQERKINVTNFGVFFSGNFGQFGKTDLCFWGQLSWRHTVVWEYYPRMGQIPYKYKVGHGEYVRLLWIMNGFISLNPGPASYFGRVLSLPASGLKSEFFISWFTGKKTDIGSGGRKKLRKWPVDYIYMSRDLWKPALMTFRTFCVKSFEKHPKSRNLTCLYLSFKHIQVDSRIHMALIPDLTSSLSCHRFPWQQLYLSNCQAF